MNLVAVNNKVTPGWLLYHRILPIMKLKSLPKVSVLIPAYNEEKYIYQALTALCKQSYPNFEIIVADNASSDRTAFVIQQFIDQHTFSNIKITMVYEGKKGTNHARECARKKATGSIIAQLDADCVPPINWLQKGVAALHHTDMRAAVTGPYDYFDGGMQLRYFSLLSQKIFYPLINTLVQFSGRAAILIGGNAFIRAEILERAGGYNTELTFYGDDVELGKRLAGFGYVAFVPGLVQQSSSRRYQASGFWQVNKKYQDFFWNMFWKRNDLLTTTENTHPR